MSEREDGPPTDLVIEKATVYTPQPGDVVVFEVAGTLTVEQAHNIRERAWATFGRDVKLVVLDGSLHFAGVVRAEAK